MYWFTYLFFIFLQFLSIYCLFIYLFVDHCYFVLQNKEALHKPGWMYFWYTVCFRIKIFETFSKKIKYEDFIFLKAEVEHSQSINKSKHLAWVMTRPIGIIETVGCSCIAGLGKLCSHAAAVIWKVGIMLRAIYLQQILHLYIIENN